jgi:hypothetical protein
MCEIEDRIIDVLATCEDLTPSEVAMALIDQDVSSGEYEGCSTDMELADIEYRRHAANVKHQLGHSIEQIWD